MLQQTVKEMLKPIGYEEYASVTGEKSETPVLNDYIIFVKNLLVNVVADGEVTTTAKIKMYCSSLGNRINHIYNALNSNRHFTGDVFLRVNNISGKELESLKKSLKAVTIELSRKVVIRINRIWV